MDKLKEWRYALCVSLVVGSAGPGALAFGVKLGLHGMKQTLKSLWSWESKEILAQGREESSP